MALERTSGTPLFNEVRSAEKNRDISIDEFSDEVILKIFGFLAAIDLAKCSLVCKNWKRIASDKTLWDALDLEKIFPSLIVVDEPDLKTLGITVTDSAPLDKRASLSLIKKFLSKIEGNAGATLLTVTEGLSLNKLIRHSACLKERGIAFTLGTNELLGKTISIKFGDIEVYKTYRVLISNTIFEQGCAPSASDQRAFLGQIGCELPKLIEMALLFQATFIKQDALKFDSKTYIQCAEKLNVDINCEHFLFPLIIGDFISNANNGKLKITCPFSEGGWEGYGAAGVYRLN